MGIPTFSGNMFGDLKSAGGVKALNEFLAEHSYIEGFVPSQADTAVFEALAGAPKSDSPHALRWYNHVKSFGAGMKQFAKASKNAADYTTGAAASASNDDDDDVDLFGSDDEDEEEVSEEKKRITEERLKAYAEKKSKTIEMDGLVWGASKLVPIGYGIKKLQLMAVVEDAKVSIDEMQEKMCEFEDFIQSVDIAAMNKI